jgi:hypothetical protein
MDFGAVVRFFAEYPGATVAVGEAFAIAYLFKALQTSQGTTLDIATKVLPVAEKLAAGMEALERVLRRADRD